MQTLRNLFAPIDYKYLVASAFVFGLFMDILDTTIVNVALAVLGQDFHADRSRSIKKNQFADAMRLLGDRVDVANRTRLKASVQPSAERDAIYAF